MGLRDRFILHIGLSREYEKKLVNLFTDKTIDEIYQVNGQMDKISLILGNPFYKIVSDSWENGRNAGKLDREAMKTKGYLVTKGKKQYLLKDQITSIYLKYISGLCKSSKLEIEEEVNRMIEIGFSFDTAMNSVVVGSLKTAFLNKCRESIIQMNTQLFDFGKKDGTWRD